MNRPPPVQSSTVTRHRKVLANIDLVASERQKPLVDYDIVMAAGSTLPALAGSVYGDDDVSNSVVG